MTGGLSGIGLAAGLLALLFVGTTSLAGAGETDARIADGVWAADIPTTVAAAPDALRLTLAGDAGLLQIDLAAPGAGRAQADPAGDRVACRYAFRSAAGRVRDLRTARIGAGCPDPTEISLSLRGEAPSVRVPSLWGTTPIVAGYRFGPVDPAWRSDLPEALALDGIRPGMTRAEIEAILAERDFARFPLPVRSTDPDTFDVEVVAYARGAATGDSGIPREEVYEILFAASRAGDDAAARPSVVVSRRVRFHADERPRSSELVAGLSRDLGVPEAAPVAVASREASRGAFDLFFDWSGAPLAGRSWQGYLEEACDILRVRPARVVLFAPGEATAAPFRTRVLRIAPGCGSRAEVDPEFVPEFVGGDPVGPDAGVQRVDSASVTLVNDDLLTEEIWRRSAWRVEREVGRAFAPGAQGPRRVEF